MKILLFDNSGMNFCRGDFLVEEKTGNFAKELKNLGNDVIFFGQKIHSSDNTIHSFRLKQNGMAVCGLYRKKNKIFNYFLLYLKAIPAILKSDFIYIFYPNAFMYIAFISKLLGKRYGLYVRGEQGLSDRVSYLIYKNAYLICTVSDYFSQFINDAIGKNIANTIRPMITFGKKDIISDREYRLKETYNILFIGRLDREKGLEELLLAIKILAEKKRKISLTIVGDGDFMNSGKEIANKLRIDDLVKFTGAVYDSNEIRKYYISSDIYILPSYHEGFPRTLYEAMIFGVPIITTFVGGISSLMKDNFNCKEIKPRSVNSIVEVLIWAMDNYPKMGELAKKGAKTVTEVFNSRPFTHAQYLYWVLNEK